MTDQIVGRDPLEKTLVKTMVAAHPDDTDEQIAILVRRAPKLTEANKSALRALLAYAVSGKAEVR